MGSFFLKLLELIHPVIYFYLNLKIPRWNINILKDSLFSFTKFCSLLKIYNNNFFYKKTVFWNSINDIKLGSVEEAAEVQQ
jgi:hypothetical protein